MVVSPQKILLSRKKTLQEIFVYKIFKVPFNIQTQVSCATWKRMFSFLYKSNLASRKDTVFKHFTSKYTHHQTKAWVLCSECVLAWLE